MRAVKGEFADDVGDETIAPAMEGSHLLARCAPRAIRRTGSEARLLPEKSRRKRLLAVARGTLAVVGEHTQTLQTDHVVAGQLLQTRELRLQTARRLAAGRPLKHITSEYTVHLMQHTVHIVCKEIPYIVENTPEAAFEKRFAADIKITLELCECCMLTEIRFLQLFEKLQYKKYQTEYVQQ